MTRPKQSGAGVGAAQRLTHGVLDSYGAVLDFLADRGRSPLVGELAKGRQAVPLAFMETHRGLNHLYDSLSAVAPATPGTLDEEWNPLSQRPHAPLPPAVSGDELGSEIIALKEAVDAFTTLSHEMMHVALWEPFFTGQWKPQNSRQFVNFSLMAEGFCFFFTDILISGTIRVCLPDGEFALERQSPGNVRFHPVRAFQALGIHDPAQILDIYLEGFAGQSTKLWQPRGTSDYAASLAAQAYRFYQGSLGYLADLYRALRAWGGLAEFYRRFCLIPGLPSILGPTPETSKVEGEDYKAYFEGFLDRGLKALDGMVDHEVRSVRWRRMLQMRAYYGLQVRWLIQNELVIGLQKPSGKPTLNQNLRHINPALEVYLDGLRALLLQLVERPQESPLAGLASLDAQYDKQVRAYFRKHDLWVGHRWLIAPRRAGGLISVTVPVSKGAMGAMEKTIEFCLDELTLKLGICRKQPERTLILAQIQRLAALGIGRAGRGSATGRGTMEGLVAELAAPTLLPLWSVPMAAFDPVHNRYRELVFSYQ